MATPLDPGLHIPTPQVLEKDQKQTKRENENGGVSILKLLTGRGGWSRVELHYGSILQYESVYTISHAVRTSGEASEDPLKSKFLSFFSMEMLNVEYYSCP